MFSDTSVDFIDFSGPTSLNISILYPHSGGYITANKNLYDNLHDSKFTKLILKESTKGTPIIKLGSGDPKVMVVSGIHGNELPPQAESIKLCNHLLTNPFKGSVYIIPFASPESSMYNVRNFKNKDLNRTSNVEGSVGNIIIKTAKRLDIMAIGDFHSSSLNSNPGKYAVFSSYYPSSESHLMGLFISKYSDCENLNYKKAGVVFKGALEDESNLSSIPAVTCEVVSSFKHVDDGSVDKSFNQMLGFLKYFGVIE